MDEKTLNEATEIATLINTLAPAGITLVKTLATSLQGKTDAQILAEADTLYQSVKDKGLAEIAETPITTADEQLNP